MEYILGLTLVSSDQLMINLVNCLVTHICLSFASELLWRVWLQQVKLWNLVAVACLWWKEIFYSCGIVSIIQWDCNAELQLCIHACLINTTTHTHFLHIPGIHLRAIYIGSCTRAMRKSYRNGKTSGTCSVFVHAYDQATSSKLKPNIEGTLYETTVKTV